MSRGRQIAKNAGALAVSRIGMLGLNFVVWVHLARTLEPDGFGVLTFGLSFLSAFLIAVALGFDPVTVREVARDHDRVTSLARTVLGIRLALCVGALVVYGVVVAVLPQPPETKRVLLILGGLLVIRALQLDWVYQGVERMGVLAARDLATSLIVAVITLTLVRQPDQVVWAAAALVAAPLLSNASLIVAYVREHGIPWPKYNRAAWLALLIPAIPLATSSFLSEIYYSLDKVMLEFLRTTGEVGLYGAGYKVFALAIAPASVLSPAFYPALASAVADRTERIRRGTDHAHVLLMAGLPIAVGGVLLSPDLIDVIFGAEYREAVPALQLLFVNAGIVYAGMAYGVPLMAWDKQTTYMRAVLIGALANVGLNLALIGPLGTVGAATATLASEALVLVAMAVAYRRMTGRLHSGIWVRSALAAVLGAGLPAGLLTSLGAPLWVSVPTVILATVCALWATGLATPELIRTVIRPPEPS